MSHRVIYNGIEGGPPRFPRAKDETKFYKNFTQARFLKNGKINSEFIPVPELCARIANVASSNLLLMQIVTNPSYEYEFIKDDDTLFDIEVVLLSERPGLQRLSYVAKYDENNAKRLLNQFCHKTILEQLDTNVNKIDQFIESKWSLIKFKNSPKPISVMVDARSEETMSKVKINKEGKTLGLKIFERLPVFVRQNLAPSDNWRPSLQLV